VICYRCNIVAISLGNSGIRSPGCSVAAFRLAPGVSRWMRNRSGITELTRTGPRGVVTFDAPNDGEHVRVGLGFIVYRSVTKAPAPSMSLSCSEEATLCPQRCCKPLVNYAPALRSLAPDISRCRWSNATPGQSHEQLVCDIQLSVPLCILKYGVHPLLKPLSS